MKEENSVSMVDIVKVVEETYSEVPRYIGQMLAKSKGVEYHDYENMTKAPKDGDYILVPVDKIDEFHKRFNLTPSE